MAGVSRSITVEQRFFSYVEKTESCWNWKGFLNKKGYAQFRINYTRHPAHRVAYLLFRGPVEAGLLVCHRCDNPRCVNPDHLFLGTNQDNVRDMVSKKRHRTGSRKPNSKMNDESVRELFTMCSKRYFEHEELAKMFGVCRPLITNILNGKRWKHLQPGGDLSLHQV